MTSEKTQLKVSEITSDKVANYLRITEIDDELKSELEEYLKIAIKYVKDESGLDDEEIDKHEDFVIVIYVLCQDMYDHRSLYIDKSNLNQVVTNILGRHRKNLL